MKRIHRGFHRIGVVLAVPLCALAIWQFGLSGYTRYTAPDTVDVIASLDEGRPVPGISHREALSKADTYLGFGLLALGGGIVWYGLCWGVGWAAAGFTRDEKP